MANFFSFLTDKVQDFSNIARKEQLALATMGLGLLLILASVVLFVI